MMSRKGEPERDRRTATAATGRPVRSPSTPVTERVLRVLCEPHAREAEAARMWTTAARKRGWLARHGR